MAGHLATAVGCARIAGPACLAALRIAPDLTDAKLVFFERPNICKAVMIFDGLSFIVLKAFTAAIEEAVNDASLLTMAESSRHISANPAAAA